MRGTVVALSVIQVMFLAPPLLPQANTGKIVGRVTSENEPLPGVVISVGSASLQGVRSTTTAGNGTYVLAQLPAGDYEMSFVLEGFAPLRQTVKVNTSQTTVIDRVMTPSPWSEEIAVRGELDTISKTIPSQVTYENETLEGLAIDRSLSELLVLAPGAHATGASREISISGSQSHENLFLVNGVVVNLNGGGSPREFFIEDALLETTVTSAGVSAEYGRFNGGVVNVITRSGGNRFSGSLRINVDQQSWEAHTPLSVEGQDHTMNETYEATLGGRILHDRLWFFLAGRNLERAETETLDRTLLPLGQSDRRTRAEAKLTFAPHSGHRLVGSYMERERVEANSHFAAIDLSTVNPRSKLPEDLVSAYYGGILSKKLFLEAEWSKRSFTTPSGVGGTTTERLGGTWIIDLSNSHFVGSPVFCAVCRASELDNENRLLKTSYFLATERLGSHDLVAGFDTFNDITVSEVHQSGSDFHVWATEPFIVRGQPSAISMPAAPTPPPARYPTPTAASPI